MANGSQRNDVPQWLEQARGGSDEALGCALDACRAYLMRIANGEMDVELQAKAGASDLVQRSLLRACRSFDQFHGECEQELLAWLRKILLNDLANFRRHYRETEKRSIQREVPLQVRSSVQPTTPARANDPSPSSFVSQQEQADRLSGALDRLPDDYRQVIELRHEEELSFREIAIRMGRSSNAVEKLWLRALERLHGELKLED